MVPENLHEGAFGMSSDFCCLTKRHFANFIEFDSKENFCLISRKTGGKFDFQVSYAHKKYP